MRVLRVSSGDVRGPLNPDVFFSYYFHFFYTCLSFFLPLLHLSVCATTVTPPILSSFFNNFAPLFFTIPNTHHLYSISLFKYFSLYILDLSPHPLTDHRFSEWGMLLVLFLRLYDQFKFFCSDWFCVFLLWHFVCVF